MTAAIQSSSRPPAQPSYIFRGHAAQIHSVQIVRQNTRLVTADAQGWIVCWKLESKRPVAVWRAHEAAILGTGEWGSDRLITHGRDNALRIWQFRVSDEPGLSTILPTHVSLVHRPKPWLLHTLPVNTLNFCAFSMCQELPARNIQNAIPDQDPASITGSSDSILVAVPARDDKKVEIYRFPQESLMYIVPRVQPTDTGMVMAVKLTHHLPSKSTLLIAGYEGGFTAVHLLGSDARRDTQATTQAGPQLARVVYLSRPHTQPILSLDVSPDAKTYFTSSADAVIAAHRIPEAALNDHGQQGGIDTSTNQTPSSSVLDLDNFAPGFQNLNIPSTNNPIEALTMRPKARSELGLSQQNPSSSTNNDDTNARQEPVPVTEQTQMLSSNQEPGISESDKLASSRLTQPMSTITPSSPASPLSFGKKPISPSSPGTTAPAASPTPSGLSSLLSSAPEQPKTRPGASLSPAVTVQAPYSLVQTKHAGQQSLHVRSDGRLLVTGGWDSRVRIYSSKTLREVAVLKWHQDGVYAAAFSEILDEFSLPPSAEKNIRESSRAENSTRRGKDESISRGHDTLGGLGKLQRQREEQMMRKHWVVAGAKDGKVSLWEVF